MSVDKATQLHATFSRVLPATDHRVRALQVAIEAQDPALCASACEYTERTIPPRAKGLEAQRRVLVAEAASAGVPEWWGVTSIETCTARTASDVHSWLQSSPTPRYMTHDRFILPPAAPEVGTVIMVRGGMRCFAPALVGTVSQFLSGGLQSAEHVQREQDVALAAAIERSNPTRK